MEPTHFDGLTKRLADPSSRRRVLGGVFAALLAVPLLDANEAGARKRKKRKKGGRSGTPNPGPVPCSARCANGCCTSEFGECIGPAQQGGDRCGSGGEPCRRCQDSTPCAANCTAGCCTSEFGECVPPDQQGGDRCGTGGERCRACDNEECRPLGGACTANDDCCPEIPFTHQCQESRCCRPMSQLCTTNDQCCPRLVCEKETDFDQETRCLGTAGVACAYFFNCAGTLACIGGRCCAPPGRDCAVADDCCQLGNLCQTTPLHGDRRVCCGPPGTLCVTHGECCGGNCAGGQCA
jgi:hypothetical protein